MVAVRMVIEEAEGLHSRYRVATIGCSPTLGKDV